MKQILISGLLFFIAFTGWAQQNEMLKKANNLYKENKFEEAINTYNSILQSGNESPELYFNLGNAFYKNKQYAKAILNFERAKLLSPNDEDIDFNIQVANQFVVDKIEPLPQLFFVKWWNSLLNKKSADAWGKLSLLLFVVGLVCCGFYLFSLSANLKRYAFISTSVFVLLTLFTFVFASKQKGRINNRDHAIVMSTTVNIKSSPSDGGVDLFVIHEGLKVTIKDKLSGWYEIKLADGNSGWIKSENVELI